MDIRGITNLICLFILAGLARVGYAEWTLIDDFGGGNLNHWNVFQENTDVSIAAGGGPAGPSDPGLRLTMPPTALKFAFVALKDTPQHGPGDQLNIAFDMALAINDTCGWGGGIMVGQVVAGVWGDGYPENQRKFYLGGNNSTFTSTSNRWYHYDLAIGPTLATLKVYTWVSANPAEYAGRTPLFESALTVPAGTNTHPILFYNFDLWRDFFDQDRDTRTIDNVYFDIIDNPETPLPPPVLWTPIDTFDTGSLSNWNIFQQNASVTAAGGTLNLDMPAVANKYAYAELKNTPQRGGFEQLTVAFDMENEMRDWYGWDGGLQIYQHGTWTGTPTLAERFGGNFTKWTVEKNNATVAIVTDPLTGGPGGSVAKLDMPALDNKWARITLKNTLQRGTDDVLKIAFDLGYQRTNWNGYEQGIGILDAAGNVVITAGHYGSVDTFNYKFFLNGELSADGLGQNSGTWYHYDLELSAVQTTLRVYPWISTDPAAYTDQVPVWKKTVNTGIGAGGYSIRFANNSMTGPSAGAIERDTMYLDNVVAQSATGAAVLSAGVFGDCGGDATYGHHFFLNGIPSGITATHSHWYHYELTMTPTQTTLKVYDRSSTDPAAYSKLTPVYETIADSGIGPGGYTFRFNNTCPPMDGYAQDRDVRHIDNLYYQVQAAYPSCASGWYDWLDQSTADQPALGSNCTLIYNTDCYPADQVQTYLDRCAQNGVVVIMDLKSHVTGPDTAGIAAFIQAWNAHPAVGGWYLADEPNGHQDWWPVDHCLAAAEVIRQYSNKPIHIAFSVGDVVDNIPAKYAQTYDISMYDQYPFTTGMAEFAGLEGSLAWKSTLRMAGYQAAAQGKTFYVVPQAFGTVPSEGFTWRLPTYGEERFMIYYAILTVEAKGVIFWADKMMDNSIAQPAEPYPSAGLQWKTEVAMPIGQELKTLGKAIAAGMVPNGVTDNAPDIASGVYRDPKTGTYYLLAVNGCDAAASPTFTLNLPIQAVTALPLEGGSPIPIVNGQFTVPFSRYAVHNYTLVPAGQVVPGDANRDGKVDVSDLGILAANYGLTPGATWNKGDFNNDGKVDVSDLGILAANYGKGTNGGLDFHADAMALGLVAGDDQAGSKDVAPVTPTPECGSAGLPLISGLILLGLMLVKLNE